MMQLNLDGSQLIHLGHAGFKLKSRDLVIYFDPYQATDETADLILISHDHFDHFDPATIDKLQKPETIIVGPKILANKISGNFHPLSPDETFDTKNIKISAIAAYNLTLPNHPKDKGYLGYIIEILGKRFYHAGDTDKTPEMCALKNIDVAMLPIAGPVMHEGEAAAAVKEFKPKIVIPMHYHDEIIPDGDSEKFANLVGESSQVKILE